MFGPGGDVYAEGVRAARRGKAIARRLVPKRTNKLRDSHGTEVFQTNRYKSRVEIYADAPHARWVHDGTTGPIHARHLAEDGTDGRLRLRRGGKRGGRKYPVLFRYSVQGQDGQPWLEQTAIALTSERYR